VTAQVGTTAQLSCKVINLYNHTVRHFLQCSKTWSASTLQFHLANKYQINDFVFLNFVWNFSKAPKGVITPWLRTTELILFKKLVQVALVIRRLFICEFAYSRSSKLYQNSVLAVVRLQFPHLFAVFG
jgi:hypothetical protein